MLTHAATAGLISRHLAIGLEDEFILPTFADYFNECEISDLVGIVSLQPPVCPEVSYLKAQRGGLSPLSRARILTAGLLPPGPFRVGLTIP